MRFNRKVRGGSGYLDAVCGKSKADVAGVTADATLGAWAEANTLFDAVGDVVTKQFGEDCHVDRVGFARAVVEVVTGSGMPESSIAPEDTAAFQHNVKAGWHPTP